MRQRLASLAPLELHIEDQSAAHAGHAGAAAGGGHYRLVLVSAQFKDLPLLARHRLVHQTLSDLMTERIHALSIQARAPGEL